MGYMQEIDRWLDALLESLPPEERAGASQQIRSKLLESYRNGQAAGRPNQTPPPAATAAYSGRSQAVERKSYGRPNRRPYRNGR